ncbi:AB abhydrolase [Acanthocystis turfacea Chlorella virus NTS-1]|nr:AB abhydrolase [Acanthocystis turfacea Chlorella virus NTS-1]
MKMSAFVNKKGLELSTYMLPANNPKATVVYFHGFGSHAMLDLRNIKGTLIDSGINIATFDYAGHGNSEGPRFIIRNHEDLIDDARTFVEIVKKDEYFNQHPIYVMGCSLGGAIASKVLEEYDAHHGILISPLYGVGDTLYYKIMSKVVSMFAHIVPDVQVSKMNQNPDEEYRTIWNSDPLTLKTGLTMCTANELLKMAKSSHSGIDHIRTDMTCLQSIRDTQVNAMLNINLFSARSSRSIVEFNNSWHGILIEQDHGIACDVILNIIMNNRAHIIS